MRARLIFLAILTTASGPAMAHGGHVGELAGHSHWLGWAALAGAAALAAWARSRRRRGREEASGEDKPAGEASEQAKG